VHLCPINSKNFLDSMPQRCQSREAISGPMAMSRVVNSRARSESWARYPESWYEGRVSPIQRLNVAFLLKPPTSEGYR
jgi:hypothetical protein